MRSILCVTFALAWGCSEKSEVVSSPVVEESIIEETYQESPDDDQELSQVLPEEAEVAPDFVATKLAGRPIYPRAAKSLAFSPDGKWLAIGHGDGWVQLWDVDQKTVAREIHAHNNWAFDLQFSADSQSLWTGGGDNRVRQWDANSGEMLQRFEDHTDDVHGVAVTDDGQHLVSGADDHLVILRDLTMDEAVVLDGHTEQVTAIALNSSDTLIASASRDDSARIWDIENRSLLQTLTGHENDVMSVAFDSSGRFLLTASYDQTARIWNVDTGELQQTFGDHPGRVFTAIWLPGEEIIATGSTAGTIRLYRFDSGEMLTQHTFDPNTEVADLAIAPDGELLAAALSDGSVQLLKFADNTLTPLREIEAAKNREPSPVESESPSSSQQ